MPKKKKEKEQQCIKNSLTFDDLPESSFLRKKDLDTKKIIPFSSATLYRKIKSGDFPKPIKISSISVWRMSDIREWQEDPGNYKAKGEQ